MTSTHTGERQGLTGTDLVLPSEPDLDAGRPASRHAAGAGGGAKPPGRPRLPGQLRLPRAPAGAPPWERPALLALLLTTAVLYLWNLGASGWGNAFYSAAAQAGSQSWKALFFASSDAANSITVDKPPVSLWVMGMSARIFGVNAWSILVPQALMGVAAVALLYASVRRAFGPVAALIAGVVLATTPVAALMFRFNNPDALLVLLLIGAAYATLRAQEKASTKWLVAAAVMIGFAFLTKMLQALLVVPAFGLVYLLAAPTTWWRRIRQLAVALVALVVSAGWYIALVELIPASARPYIGGSQNNSILELTLGYNGLGRITGNETGSVGGGGQGGGWGETGWLRLFNSENGGQISWLLPAALLLLIAGFWATRRAPRTDSARAAFGVWGGWLLITCLVFSHMQGIFHAYYNVALAPAIAAVVGAGSVTLWRARGRDAGAGAGAAAILDGGLASSPRAATPPTATPPTATPPTATRRANALRAVARTAPSVVLAVATAGTAVWSYALLDRTPDWNPWLRNLIVVVGVAAGLLLLVADRLPRRVAFGVATAALVATLLGPTAYSIATAGTPHSGAIPSAGPASAGGFGPGGGRRLMTAPNGTDGGPPTGGAQPNGGISPNGATQPFTAPGMPTGGGGRGGNAGGIGGLLGASEPSDELVNLLTADADAYTWVAAAVGSNSAAGVQLATGEPVMAVGGFNGSDPSPTLAEFQEYVAQGKIHYFLGGGGFGGGMTIVLNGEVVTGGGGQTGGSRESSEIASWVEANFTATTVGGTTVYDLTTASTSTAGATGN